MTQRYTHVLLEGKQNAMAKMSGVLFENERRELPSEIKQNGAENDLEKTPE